MFQSTRPRGARPKADVGLVDVIRFNPRARGGRDQSGDPLLTALRGFNPRARGGRDQCSTNLASLGNPFQSTRPRGARQN